VPHHLAPAFIATGPNAHGQKVTSLLTGRHPRAASIPYPGLWRRSHKLGVDLARQFSGYKQAPSEQKLDSDSAAFTSDTEDKRQKHLLLYFICYLFCHIPYYLLPLLYIAVITIKTSTRYEIRDEPEHGNQAHSHRSAWQFPSARPCDGQRRVCSSRTASYAVYGLFR
jgi:hypothetical protein